MTDRTIFWEVDLQADFMLPGGNLYVPGAEKIIPNIRRLVDHARQERILLVSSRDVHAPDDPEFKLFPPHCIKGTPGAQIIPEGLMETRLMIPNDPSFLLPKDFLKYDQIIFEKQTLDVFSNPKADELVQLLGTGTEYVVFGVVTEYCVRCAAKGLLDRNRKIAIVRDAIETLEGGASIQTLEELEERGARLIVTEQVVARMAASEYPKAL
jgi:nicotinamidase/pyrazinamidase